MPAHSGKSLAILLKAHVAASRLVELAHQYNESIVSDGLGKPDSDIARFAQISRGNITGIIRFPTREEFSKAIKEMENDKIDRDLLAVTLDFHGCPDDLIRIAAKGDGSWRW